MAFVNVTVVPMDRERVVGGQTVIVRDGRIALVGPAETTPVPGGTARVDGGDKFLMPGLAEMHAHVPSGAATDADIERVLFLYAANGVTTARGMLGGPRHLPLRDRLARGEVVGPALVTSGPSFNGRSATTGEAASAMVSAQKAAGYDFLKIHPGLGRGVFDDIVDAAARAGLRLAGHVPLEVGLKNALDARMLTIDHLDGYLEAMVRTITDPGSGRPGDALRTGTNTTRPEVDPKTSQWFGLNLAAHLDERRIADLVARTKRAGTWNVPTQSLLEHTAGAAEAAQMAAWPEMRYVPAAQIAQWTETKAKLLQMATPEERGTFLLVRRRLIEALHDGGAGLLLGSDAPQMWNVPGFSIHRELRFLVLAGLTPYEALVTGTRNVATFLGRPAGDGTVVAGARADLVLVHGNPLEDVGNAARIAGVMVGGRWLTRDAIDGRLREYVVAR
jgi:imidazolonepropionase-like amidohydrolase